MTSNVAPHEATRPRHSGERFQAALKGLMEERHLSYRQLAYKTHLSFGYLCHLTRGTRPVPADTVIRTIAAALCVEADLFREYRLHQIAEVLERSTQLTDALYGVLLSHTPVSDGLRAMLEGRDNDNGDGESDAPSQALAV
jgi:transcriptional regulator with XRE-family HTH domain